MKKEALKLADELENKPNAYGDCIQEWLIEASDMIRKLVAENDNLFKALIAEQEHNEKLVAELDKQCEPVAWTDDLWTIFVNDEYCMLDEDMKKDMIPLYTAPQTISDDEVIERYRELARKGY